MAKNVCCSVCRSANSVLHYSQSERIFIAKIKAAAYFKFYYIQGEVSARYVLIRNYTISCPPRFLLIAACCQMCYCFTSTGFFLIRPFPIYCAQKYLNLAVFLWWKYTSWTRTKELQKQLHNINVQVFRTVVCIDSHKLKGMLMSVNRMQGKIKK